MADILHRLHVRAPVDAVFAAVSTPEGLDAWWTKESAGSPVAGTEYRFGFGPGYDWRGVVRSVEPGRSIEWELTRADADWTGTRVGFELAPEGDGTSVEFRHTGWKEANDHCRISSYCWAAYLRLMRRNVMHGEVVPYEARLEV